MTRVVPEPVKIHSGFRCTDTETISKPEKTKQNLSFVRFWSVNRSNRRGRAG